MTKKSYYLSFLFLLLSLSIEAKNLDKCDKIKISHYKLLEWTRCVDLSSSGQNEEVKKYYKVLCEGKDEKACFRYAFISEIDKDYETSAEAYISLCKKKVANACHSLGKLIRKLEKEGKSTMKIMGEAGSAYDCLQKGCEYGYGPSCLTIANDTTKENFSEEVKLQIQLQNLIQGCAAKEPSDMACFMLGMMYKEAGQKSKAKKFLSKACSLDRNSEYCRVAKSAN